MPNVRISNGGAHIGIRNVVPTTRTASGQGVRLTHEGGSPIGLLLALTYASTIAEYMGDARPTVRIFNNG